MAVADDIAARLVRNQVNVLRYSAGVQRDVRAILAKLTADLKAELARIDPTAVKRTAYQRARLETLAQAAEEAIKTAYKEITKTATGDLKALASIQGHHVIDAVNGAVGANVIGFGFTQEQIGAIVSDALIEGAPSAEWWAGQSDALRLDFVRAMRAGMLRGETVRDLGNRVLEVMDTSRSRAEMLVRTSVVHTANAAHMAVFRDNGDVIKGIQWMSTLDTRTTPQCRGLDGKTWDLDLNPVGHSLPYPGPTAHWGCRSTQVPWLKSFEEMAQEAGSNTALGRALDQIDEGTRASMGGQVAGSLTYEGWLAGQPVAVQKQVLGPGRYELWKADKLTLAEMLDQRGNPLTLDELKG